MTARLPSFVRSFALRCVPAVAAVSAGLIAVGCGSESATKSPAADGTAAATTAPAANQPAWLPPADPKDDAVTAAAKLGYLGEESNWPAHAAMLGKPAPNLELSDWINGPAEGAMKDKIVVVDFWATWCGPCLKAVPHNNEVAKKYADKGVILIGACGGGGEQTIAARAEQTRMAYPVAKTTKESTEAWQVQWWPTYAVVDRKGTVRAIGLKHDAVEKVLDALLAEQPAMAAASAVEK